MNSLDEELKSTIRRNMLLGLWAAEKLGLAGGEAEACSMKLSITRRICALVCATPAASKSLRIVLSTSLRSASSVPTASSFA